MSKCSLFVTLFVLAGAALDSSGAVINFTVLTQPGTGFNSVSNPYIQDGFEFTGTSGGFGNTIGAFQSGSANHPAGGAAATSFTAFFGDTLVSIFPLSGTFDLVSIDLAEWGANQGGGTGTFSQTFTGSLFGGGTVSQTFTITRTPTPVLSTFTFSGFTHLTEMHFTQGIFASGGGIQFDNLVTGAAVPEPSAGLLVAGALLFLASRKNAHPVR